MFLRMTMLCVCVVLLTGCDFRVERDYKRLVYHQVAEADTLNPILSSSAYSTEIESVVYDTMVARNNETLEFNVPMLAKSWDISVDHLQYTFYLRDDVYWHDGKKFTADDVIYSFDRIMDPKVDAAHLRNYYRDVVKAEKLGEYAVRFTYATPYYRAFIIIGALPIVPKHIFDNGGDFNKDPAGRHPVGTGPYKFREWVTGTSVILDKNENYWGEKPKLSGITFMIIPDMSVALQVLKKREIDVMTLSPLQWEKQTGSKNFIEYFDKYKYYLPGYSFIAWNGDRPFFKDKRVRRAMTQLLDREKINEKLMYGLSEVVSGDFFKYSPEYNSALTPYPYDPKEAIRLLESAGWVDHDGDGIRDKDGVPFRFTMMTSGAKGGGRAISILRENLKNVGIDMDIAQFEWTVFGKNLQDRAFDATSLGWTGMIEPDPYQVWHSSQVEQGSNFVYFKNKETDQIIESARQEFDSAKRIALYRRFHEILHEEQPYTFLFMKPELIAIEKRFTNVKVYKVGVDIREWGAAEPAKPLYQ